MTDLERVLQELGFDANEVRAYVELLQSGPLAVAPLGKRLGVPRTTAYTMLSRLVERGLVRESVRKGLKTYVAEPPDTINHVFALRLTSLETARQKFEELLPDLKSRQSKSSSSPRLMILDGKDGLQNLLRDMLLYSDIATSAVWPIRKMMEVLSPEFFALHNKERIKRNIYTRAVWPHTEVVPIEDYPFLGWGKDFKREIRVAPTGMEYVLGYWIYANKVAFLSSAHEGYGFIIQSQELATTLAVQFELLWAASTPLAFPSAAVEPFLRDLHK